MNPIIHIRGSIEDRDAVHFAITRNGLPENVLTRNELRLLSKMLSKEMGLLSRIDSGCDAMIEVCTSEGLGKSQEASR